MEEQEERASAEPVEPPTEAEDIDLVALMDEANEPRRFYVPTGKGTVSDTYYIEARHWTVAQEARYLGAGMQMSSPMPTRHGQTNAADELRYKPNVLEQLQALVEGSVVGYRLRRHGHDVVYSEGAAHWSNFRHLPPKVATWVRNTLRVFQGIEMATEAEEKVLTESAGEA